MSTVLDWRSAEEETTTPIQEESVGEIPVMHLLVTYVLLVPLVLFAVHGGFSFEHSSSNSDLGAIGGKLAFATTESEAMRDRIQTSLGLAICGAAMATSVRALAAAAQAMPLMMVLPLYAISSALWSQDSALTLRSGVSLTVTTLFAFYLARRFSQRQQMHLLMATGVCVGLGSVALALLWPQYGVDHQGHEGAWQGLFTQKNACGQAMLFLLTPALASSPQGRYGQMLRMMYIALCLAVILMTQSRTGWAITLLYLGFAFMLQLLGRFGRRDMLPLVAATFGAAGAGLVAILAYPLATLALIGRSETLSGRAQIWRAISVSILRRPWGGYGFDAFWSLLGAEASRIFASTGWVVTSSHNGYLNVALELGLVGLALVLVTFVQAARHANAAFHPGRSDYVDWCIGIVFLTVLYNLDERTFLAPQYLPWILYIMACLGLRTAAFHAPDQSSALLAEEAP